MHQCVVVTVFILRGELQIAVQMQANVVAPAGNYDALVGCRFGIDDLIRVDAFFGQGRELVGEDEAAGQQHQRNAALRCQVRSTAQRIVVRLGEHFHHPQRDQHIEDAEQQAGAHQPQMRGQQQRKCDRHRERAEVVEGEHLRHHLLERQLVPENSHDQRNFQANEHAGDEHQAVEHQTERAGQVREHQKQHHGGEAADYPDQDFDLHKADRQAALDVARQP